MSLVLKGRTVVGSTTTIRGQEKKSIKYDLARHLGYMKQCNAVQACSSSSMPVRPPIQDTQQARGQRSVSFRARPKV